MGNAVFLILPNLLVFFLFYNKMFVQILLSFITFHKNVGAIYLSLVYERKRPDEFTSPRQEEERKRRLEAKEKKNK